MKYKVERLTLESAKDALALQQYGLIYTYSGIELIDIQELFEDKVINPECFEARFFSNNSEIHMLEANGKKEYFQLSDVNENSDEATEGILNAEIVDRNYRVANRFRPWKNVKVRQYLVPDNEDGQMSVAATRLVGLEK